MFRQRIEPFQKNGESIIKLLIFQWPAIPKLWKKYIYLHTWRRLIYDDMLINLTGY